MLPKHCRFSLVLLVFSWKRIIYTAPRPWIIYTLFLWRMMWSASEFYPSSPLLVGWLVGWLRLVIYYAQQIFQSVNPRRIWIAIFQHQWKKIIPNTFEALELTTSQFVKPFEHPFGKAWCFFRKAWKSIRSRIDPRFKLPKIKYKAVG